MAVLLFGKNDLVTPVAVEAINLFFVRVNQVLVRLWARHQWSVFSCRLSEVSDRRHWKRASGRRFGQCLTGKAFVMAASS